MTIQLMNSLWERLAGSTAEALRMTDGEATRFSASKVAKLVGLIPYIAMCEDAERTALAHLATLVIADRGQARVAFDHAPADDAEPLARLRTIADFKGGDRGCIERGMALLGLCMFSGYRRDAETDTVLGSYNPVNSAAGAAADAERSLKSVLEAGSPTQLDAIMSVDEAVQGYWKG